MAEQPPGADQDLLFSDMANFEALLRADPSSAQLRAWASEHLGHLRAARRGAQAHRVENGQATAPSSWARLMDSINELDAHVGDPVANALGALMHLTGAQRGFLATPRLDGSLEFLVARAFATLDVDAPEAQLSRSILAAALEGEARALWVDDAGADARFEQQPSVARLRLRSVLVVPLILGGRAVGVLYLDDPEHAAAFSPEARDVAQTFARAVTPWVQGAVRRRRATANARARMRGLRARGDFAGVVAATEATVRCLSELLVIAHTRIPALISGPSGVGKTLFAELLHRNTKVPTLSTRADESEQAELETGTLERVHALPDEGHLAERVEHCDADTLLLEQVDRASAAALQLVTQRYKARVHAPRLVMTAVEVTPEVETLRAELGATVLEIPPLRGREADIEALALKHVEALASNPALPKEISDAALAKLFAYAWPGNARELLHAVERASHTLTHHLGPEAFTLAPRDAAARERNLKSAVRDFRRQYVHRVFQACEGDAKRMADRLGVNRKYVYQLLKDLKLG